MIYYIQSTNQYVASNQPFTFDGNQYPENWIMLSTDEDKSAIGMQLVIAQNARANDAYYWVTETRNGPTLTYINTPKDLDQTKATCKSRINATAYNLLLPNDWMVVKATETSTPIDPAWNTWRQSIRVTAADSVTAVMAAVDMPALEAVMGSITWPHDPDYVEPQQSTIP